MSRRELIEAYKHGLKRGIQLREREFMGKDVWDFQIPTWALNYLVNGDDHGLDMDDMEMVRKFESEYDVLEWGEDEHFSHYPAFGLPCNVVDCKCCEK